MRLAGALLLGTAALLFAFRWMPVSVEPALVGAGAAALLVLDGLYWMHVRRRRAVGMSERELRRSILVQVLGDCSVLSLLSYAAGTVGTPVYILFLPHIVVLSLLFDRRRSLTATLVAAGFSGAPLLAEHVGLLPVVTVFGSRFKQEAIESLGLTVGFTVAITVCYLACWYTVSEVAKSIRKQQSTLQVAYERLLQTSDERSRATLRATHELKAPFVAIKSYVHALEGGYAGELPSEAARIVARIGARCDALLARITALLKLSNLRTLQGDEMPFVRTRLEQIVGEVAAEGRAIGKPTEVEVRMLVEARSSYWVYGVPEHLRTLVAEVLLNAVRYSRPGGTVELELVRRPGAGPELQVRDRGIGIPEENLSRVFEEHFRCNNAASHSSDGSGLGLAMVAQIARLHGVDLQIESALGEGTTVTMRFPLPPAQPNGARGD